MVAFFTRLSAPLPNALGLAYLNARSLDSLLSPDSEGENHFQQILQEWRTRIQEVETGNSVIRDSQLVLKFLAESGEFSLVVEIYTTEDQLIEFASEPIDSPSLVINFARTMAATGQAYDLQMQPLPEMKDPHAYFLMLWSRYLIADHFNSLEGGISQGYGEASTQFAGFLYDIWTI